MNFIEIYDNALTPEMCKDIINYFEVLYGKYPNTCPGQFPSKCPKILVGYRTVHNPQHLVGTTRGRRGRRGRAESGGT